MCNSGCLFTQSWSIPVVALVFYLHFVYCLVGGSVCWVFLVCFFGFVFGAAGCIVVVMGAESCGMLSCSYGELMLRDFSPCL